MSLSDRTSVYNQHLLWLDMITVNMHANVLPRTGHVRVDGRMHVRFFEAERTVFAFHPLVETTAQKPRQTKETSVSKPLTAPTVGLAFLVVDAI